MCSAMLGGDRGRTLTSAQTIHVLFVDFVLPRIFCATHIDLRSSNPSPEAGSLLLALRNWEASASKIHLAVPCCGCGNINRDLRGDLPNTTLALSSFCL